MASSFLSTELLVERAGTNLLWLTPDDPAHESKTMAQMSELAQGKFISIAYQWDFDDQPQDGLIVFSGASDRSAARAMWLDSWHMRNVIMICESSRVDDSVFSLPGSYPAPPEPDWGWRIDIEQPERTRLVIRMTNISLDHEESLAVLAEYRRTNDSG